MGIDNEILLETGYKEIRDPHKTFSEDKSLGSSDFKCSGKGVYDNSREYLVSLAISSSFLEREIFLQCVGFNEKCKDLCPFLNYGNVNFLKGREFKGFHEKEGKITYPFDPEREDVLKKLGKLGILINYIINKRERSKRMKINKEQRKTTIK